MRKRQKRNKYERQIYDRNERLRQSLPNMDIEDVPVYPVVTPKESHPIIGFIILSIVILLTLVFNSLYVVTRVSGDSMDPTLKSGHFMLLSRHDKVDRFDIAVFNERMSDGGKTKKIVKRVIGLPGDVVTVIDGKLYINHDRYDEPYLDNVNTKNWQNVDWTITVPKGHYFVLGDNRDISKDSRSVGSFTKSSVVGVKVLGGKD